MHNYSLLGMSMLLLLSSALFLSTATNLYHTNEKNIESLKPCSNINHALWYLIHRKLHAHRIVHFDGRPQGPSLSLGSGAGSDFGAAAAFGFSVFVIFSSSFFSIAASLLGSSSQNANLLRCSPKAVPWMVATSISRADG